MQCFFSSRKSCRPPPLKGKFSKQINTRFCPQQISILGLIYEDLASRCLENKLTYEHFLDFFDLTGLWGVKLFEHFDEDGRQLVSFEEFLYGMAQTAKAPFDDKVRLLYLFFEEDIQRGISFRKFVKMVCYGAIQLYNYSKEQLKEILIQDGLYDSTQRSVAVSTTFLQTNPNPPSLHSHSSLSQSLSQSQSFPIPPTLSRNPSKLVQLNVSSPDKKPTSAFENAYNDVLSVHDEGTYLEFSDKELRYKIRYGNMASLVKEFAKKVYRQHGIDVADQEARLSYERFCVWIKSHKKLYKSYYSSFHTQIWQVTNQQPSYLTQPISLQFTGKLECHKQKSQVYGFQVEDIIIFCQDRKHRKKPIKIVCLEGLTITNLGGLRIEFSHRSECYRNFVMGFYEEAVYREWVDGLAIYQRESINNNYFINQVIGTGSYSIVYRCIHKQTHKPYALKVIQFQKLTPAARQAISNQSQILKVLNHPQILKYVDTVWTKTHEYIITEYIYGEDLYQYVRKRKFLNEFESAFIIGNVMNAVMYLHELEIMHRDLKPENIMVMFKDRKEGEYFQLTTPTLRKGQRIENIKIIDFGLSNHISNLEKLQKRKLAAAPQLLLSQSPLTLKSDVFSIGAILYFLLKGTLPFAQLNRQKTILNTVGGVYDISSSHWDHISLQAKDLLVKMLQPFPKQRIDLKQAINHEWFNRFQNKSKKTPSNNSPSECSNTNSEACNKSIANNVCQQDRRTMLQQQEDLEMRYVRKVSTSESKYNVENWQSRRKE